jgi:hypothetical protein
MFWLSSCLQDMLLLRVTKDLQQQLSGGQEERDSNEIEQLARKQERLIAVRASNSAVRLPPRPDSTCAQLSREAEAQRNAELAVVQERLSAVQRKNRQLRREVERIGSAVRNRTTLAGDMVSSPRTLLRLRAIPRSSVCLHRSTRWAPRPSPPPPTAQMSPPYRVSSVRTHGSLATAELAANCAVESLLGSSPQPQPPGAVSGRSEATLGSTARSPNRGRTLRTSRPHALVMAEKLAEYSTQTARFRTQQQEIERLRAERERLRLASFPQFTALPAPPRSQSNPGGMHGSITARDARPRAEREKGRNPGSSTERGGQRTTSGTKLPLIGSR